MKNLLFIFMIFLLFLGCKKSYSPYSYSSESTIYSDSQTTQFKELDIIIEPFVMIGNLKQYIVTDTIKNVRVKINDKIWGIYNSFGIDTSLFKKDGISNLYLTSTLTKYSVIASYSANNDTLKTAGEYAGLLNNYLTLKPGNYICEIESFEIKQIDGTIKKIKPFIVAPFEVKENYQSALLGEFEIQINN